MHSMETLKNILLSTDPVRELRALIATGELSSVEPTLAELLMPIPTGYHHKDNLEHSIRVLGNAIEREVNGPDLILRTAALFHDIGKPATRQFGPKGSVTFTNHDVIGAKMVKSILPSHGYSKEEVSQIATLVHMHMRSHTFKTGWSESAVRRMIVDAGSADQLERLIVVFYSDATTKIDANREGIHRNVSLLADALNEIQKKDARAKLRPALNGNEVAEILNLAQGIELGKAMKLLNQDQNIGLEREDAIALLKENFPQVT
jgi:poly(A) polymerase